MKIKIRHQDVQELDSFRIEKDGREFQIKETAGGIEVIDIGINNITIQPQVANSIIILTT